MVEVVVANEAAIRLPARGAKFVLVQLLEDRALVPSSPLIFLEGLLQVVLRDVKDADFEHLVGLGVIDQVMQPSPGAFEGLKILVMHDKIDLLRELAVDLGDRSEEHTS